MVTSNSPASRAGTSKSEAIEPALANVAAAQGELPMARVWGMGTTASADGQF